MPLRPDDFHSKEEKFEPMDYSCAHLFSQKKLTASENNLEQLYDERKRLKEEIKQRCCAIQTMFTQSSPAKLCELDYLRKLQEIDRAQLEGLAEKIEAFHEADHLRP